MDLHDQSPVLRTILAGLLAVAAAAPSAWGQADVSLTQEKQEPRMRSPDEIPRETPAQTRKLPQYKLTVTQQAEADGTKSLVAFVEIPYAHLNFKRDGDEYVARFQADLTLESKAIGKDTLLKGRWFEDVRVKTYEETRGRGKVRSLLSVRRIVEVPPSEGKTTMGLKVTDSESLAVFVRRGLEMEVVRQAPKTVKLSAPLLVAKHDPSTLETTPLMSNTYKIDRQEKKDLSYYLRMYNETEADAANVTTSLKTCKPQADSPSQCVEEKALWSETSKVSLQPGVNELLRTHAQALSDEFLNKSGPYKIEILVAPEVNGVPVPGGGFVQTKFTVNYLGLSADFDPELVVKQLGYLESYPRHFLEEDAVADEIKKDIKATREIGMERCGIFGRLGKKCVTKDPAKLAERHKAIAALINRLPEELRGQYFQRIELANHHFGPRNGVGRAGWETDRGMVFIVLGAMDDRQTDGGRMIGEVGTDVWYYFSHPMTGRQFQVGFYDERGYEDYRLMDEISTITIDGRRVGLCQVFGNLCYSSRDWAKGTN